MIHEDEMEDEEVRVAPVRSKAHDWGDEDYTLTKKMRTRSMWGLGVDPQRVLVDLFASRSNATQRLLISREMNAFSFNWGLLKEGDKDVLWANPPFSMLEKVVVKVLLDPCKIILCTPEWRDQPWWKPLERVTVSRIYLPWDEGLFVGKKNNKALPHPHWRTVVSFVDTTRWSARIPQKSIVKWIQQQNKD